MLKYLYIQRTRIGWDISRDVPGKDSREGAHYVGYSRRQAVQAFRRDFDCIGKHFIVIEY